MGKVFTLQYTEFLSISGRKSFAGDATVQHNEYSNVSLREWFDLSVESSLLRLVKLKKLCTPHWEIVKSLPSFNITFAHKR